MVGLGLTYNTLASMKESRTNRGSVPRSSLMELFRTLGFQLGVPVYYKRIFFIAVLQLELDLETNQEFSFKEFRISLQQPLEPLWVSSSRLHSTSSPSRRRTRL